MIWPADEEDAKIYDPVASNLGSLLADDQAPEELPEENFLETLNLSSGPSADNGDEEDIQGESTEQQRRREQDLAELHKAMQPLHVTYEERLKLEKLKRAADIQDSERENAATALQTTFRGRQVRKAVAKEKLEKKQQEDVHASVTQAVENDGVTADKPFQTFSKPLLTARVGRTESTAKYVTWELPSLAVSPEELKAKFEQ